VTRRSMEIAFSSSQTPIRHGLTSDNFKDRGAQFIKVYSSLSWPLKRVVAEEARRLGLPVIGHGRGVEEITESVINGFFSVQHTGGRTYDDVLQMLARAGTRWDPTLALEGGDALIIRDEPERLSQEKFLLFVPPWQVRKKSNGGNQMDVPTAILRADIQANLARIRDARRCGSGVFVRRSAR
jgi:hypothetical protein